ncbi:hypothetical protein TNCV_852531 [Trichonephila clavipes]|nr:hypothetical protein TNCV_852531 [Trichonephila clavipes]
MPPVLRSQIEAHKIHHGKGLNVRLSLAVALSSIQVTGFTIGLRQNKHLGGGSGVSHLSSPAINLTRGLAARRGGFRIIPPRREGTVHLQTPMSSPGFEPRPNGTAVSPANPYTGWATGFIH